MSTKIYDAYRVINDLSMDNLMKYFFRIREEYLDHCVEFVKNTKTDSATFNEISKELRESIRNEGSFYNFKADIMVYFHEGEKYIQFFGMNFPHGNALEELYDFLTDYHYQNQSDPWWSFTDEEYTDEQIAGFEKDYKEREEVWDAIYSKYYRPNEVGLVFELCTKNDYYTIARRVFGVLY